MNTLPKRPKISVPSWQSCARRSRRPRPRRAESIAYGMAGFKYKGKPLIYFANWKGHIALYGSFADEYADELNAFELAKGTVRFPPDHPPSDRLLTKIVKGRIAAIDAAG
jgi:uncharacterized protein YdhG (YjbR/CyaY superfamily)